MAQNVPFFFDGERKVFVSSAANRTTDLAVENPAAHYQEIGGNLSESNGSVWNPINASGVPLTIPTIEVHVGTTATRTGLSLGATDYGYFFKDTDLNKNYMWDGAAWDLYPQWVGGAGLVVDGALASGPIYNSTDGLYKYFGEALPGTALTAATWRVSRMTISDSRIEWADGNGNLDNVYTSLAVVAALSFS